VVTGDRVCHQSPVPDLTGRTESTGKVVGSTTPSIVRSNWTMPSAIEATRKPPTHRPVEKHHTSTSAIGTNTEFPNSNPSLPFRGDRGPRGATTYPP
jgi:hypothetical protein